MRRKMIIKQTSILCLIAVSAFFLLSCGKKDDYAEPVEVAPEGDIEVDQNAAESFYQEGDGIGAVTCVPNSSPAFSALAGSNAFTFYFENPDVAIGTGNITFYEADTSDVLDTIDMTEAATAERAEISAITDEGKSLTGYTSGRQCTIYLSRQFERTKSYYVLMEPGVFTANGSPSNAVTTPDKLTFTTTQYGIGQTDFPERTVSGTSVYIPIYLSGAVTKAEIKDLSAGRIDFSEKMFTADSSVKVTFDEPGESAFTIYFYDSSGQEVAAMPFSFEVTEAS